jgi:hypothetical protein
MNQLLQISMRVTDCEENGWTDLLSKLDEITQSLIDNPSAGHQIKTALLYWKDAVDCRLNGLPPEEDEVLMRNPLMTIRESFGTEV